MLAYSSLSTFDLPTYHQIKVATVPSRTSWFMQLKKTIYTIVFHPADREREGGGREWDVSCILFAFHVSVWFVSGGEQIHNN